MEVHLKYHLKGLYTVKPVFSGLSPEDIFNYSRYSNDFRMTSILYLFLTGPVTSST